jgi:hypothetical protein
MNEGGFTLMHRCLPFRRQTSTDDYHVQRAEGRWDQLMQYGYSALAPPGDIRVDYGRKHRDSPATTASATLAVAMIASQQPQIKLSIRRAD